MIINLKLNIWKCAFLHYVFTVLLLSPRTTTACEYAGLGKDHTMCIYKTPACNVVRSGLNQEQKLEILHAHNLLRQKVANGHEQGLPGASNMKEVGWNYELEKIAQKWSEQCVYGHDHNRKTVSYLHVGQNIHMSFSNKNKNSEVSGTEAVNAWFVEGKQFGFKVEHINPFVYQQELGHYTQLLWAETDYIGCGFIHFQKHTHEYVKHIICNYAPGGNIVGEQMYEVGSQCSKCKNGCSPKYPGLCRFSEPDDINIQANGSSLIVDFQKFPEEEEEVETAVRIDQRVPITLDRRDEEVETAVKVGQKVPIILNGNNEDGTDDDDDDVTNREQQQGLKSGKSKKILGAHLPIETNDYEGTNNEKIPIAIIDHNRPNNQNTKQIESSEEARVSGQLRYMF